MITLHDTVDRHAVVGMHLQERKKHTQAAFVAEITPVFLRVNKSCRPVCFRRDIQEKLARPTLPPQWTKRVFSLPPLRVPGPPFR